LAEPRSHEAAAAAPRVAAGTHARAALAHEHSAAPGAAHAGLTVEATRLNSQISRRQSNSTPHLQGTRPALHRVAGLAGAGARDARGAQAASAADAGAAGGAGRHQGCA